VAGRVTRLCVGAAAVLVGQACGPGPRPSTLAVAPEPELVIPRFDGGGGPPPNAADGVHFGHPIPVAKTGWTVTVHASSQSADAQGGMQVSTYESEYKVEIVAVDGPAPTRVRLRFLRNVYVFGDAQREAPTPIDRKEYVVDARAPHVRDADTGAAAPEAESQRVLDVFPDLGTRTRIDEVLPDAAMHVGDVRDELAAAILRVIHPRAWALRAGTATLARVAGDVAVFEVSLDAASESGLHLDVRGEARVRLVDSQLVELALDGRYETGPDAGTSDPPGTFSLRRTLTSDLAPRIGR
jgi:hypothetical protein